MCAREQLGVYFYGSTGETLSRISTALDARFGGRLGVARAPSRFGPVDRHTLGKIAQDINSSGAAICLVGLGCPRQERFVAAIAPSLEMPALAVGAAFDYLAGNIRRAPLFMQRAGLEWLYRTAQEPRRLAGRYATTNLAFATGVARQVIRSRTLRNTRPPRAEPSGAVHDAELVDA